MRTTAVVVALLTMVLTACSGSSTDTTAEAASAAESAVARANGEDGLDAAPADTTLAATKVEGDAASDGAGITVRGAGEATGTPDVVRVTVGVDVRRPTVQDALDRANAATQRVLDGLDDEGVAKDDRQTRQFSIRPEYDDGDADGTPRVTGYGVSNLVEATVRDIDRVGAILSAVAEAGGDDVRIQGVGFDLEDDGEQVAAARRAAFADARATAEQYAELAGAELGPLISIEDTSVNSPRSAEVAQAALSAAAESAVPIEPGEQQVVVQTTVRWSVQ